MHRRNEPSRKRAIDCVVKWPMQQRNDVHSFRTLNCNINTTNARATPCKYRHAFEIKCNKWKTTTTSSGRPAMKEQQWKQQHALVRRSFRLGKERRRKKTGKKCRMKLLVPHRAVSAARCVVVHLRLALKIKISFMQPVAWPQPRLKGARKKNELEQKRKKILKLHDV